MSLNDAIIQENFRAKTSPGNSEFEIAAEEYVEERSEDFASDVVDGEFKALERKRKPIVKYLLIGLGVLGIAGTGGVFLMPHLLGSPEPIDFAALSGQSQQTPLSAPVLSHEQSAGIALPSQADQPTFGIAPEGAGVQPHPALITDPAALQLVGGGAPAVTPVVGVSPEAKFAMASPEVAKPVSVPIAETPKPTPVAQAPAAPVKVAIAPPSTTPVVKKVVEAEKKSPEPAKPISQPKSKPIEVAQTRQSDVIVGDKTIVNDVKPLVTVTANQIGLRSLMKDGLVVSVSGELQRFKVGDYLPSGDRVVFIDSQAYTIVTDKQIIRVVN